MPTLHQRVDDTEVLRSLNLEVTEWERAGGASSKDVARVLDAKFLFRRGDGTTTDRNGFLAGLTDPDNETTELVPHVAQIQVMDAQAFAEVFVYLDGKRSTRPVKGWFRNLRLWEKQKDGAWRCVSWFNKALPNG